jgi:hypothetical protein
MGVVQTFRRASSPEASRQFKLQGLQPGAQYETENLDGPRQVASGRQLMEEGLSVSLGGRPAAAVVIYRRLASAVRAR